MTNESEIAWRLLEAGPKQDLNVRKSGVKVAAGEVLHALDASGARHLLLPVMEDDPGLDDTRSRGVTVSTRALTAEGDASERRFVDIKCEDPRLRDLFSKVCDEILQHCRTKPDAPASVTETVLERWRALLGPASRRLLSEQQVRGLLAELHMLEQVATVSSGKAMTVWTGADRARHDFTGQVAACEVKASTIVDEVKIHVNGLRQLEPPPGSTLYLYIERMESVPVGGDCIPAAIDRLESLGIDRVAMLTALAKAGVAAADLVAYEAVKFRLLEKRAYRVNDAFPRLIPSLLAGAAAQDRISNVEYVLSLGAQPPVPLDDGQRDQIPVLLVAEADD